MKRGAARRVLSKAIGVDARWYDARKLEAHDSVFAVAHSIHERTRWLRDKDKYHAELYEGEGALDESHRGQKWEGSTLPYNVVRMAVDTVTAKVAKERHLPQCFTNRGNWALQKRARRASEALEGEFARLGIFEELYETWVTDAETSRAGILKVFRDTDRVGVDRVLPWELLVDPTDAKYGKPRNIYHVRTVDDSVLAAMFPKQKQAILDASEKGSSQDWDYQVSDEDSSVGRVRVVECWHLPARATRPGPKGPTKGTGDGRHIICIDGVTLVDEEYDEESFPFVVLRFKPRRIGFWGTPIAEIVEGFQYEINSMSEAIQDSFHLAGKGVILQPIGSEIVDSHITNGIGVVIKHKPGLPPQWINPEPVHPQFLQRQAQLPQDALGEAGVSQMSARSQKPTGLIAAKALETLDDVETERFSMFERNVQAACVELGKKILAVIRQIAEDLGDYVVPYNGKRGIQDLSWAKDFSLDANAYNLKIFNTSLLSKRPEARYQQLFDGFSNGLYNREQFFRLNEMPDLERENDLECAGQLLADDQIQTMLDAEDDEASLQEAYQRPEPYQDLEYAKRRAQVQYCLARMNGCPEGNLQLLRDYIEDCKEEIAKLQPPPPPVQIPVPGPMPVGLPPDVAPGAGPLPPGAPMPPMPPMPQGPAPMPIAA